MTHGGVEAEDSEVADNPTTPYRFLGYELVVVSSISLFPGNLYKFKQQKMRYHEVIYIGPTYYQILQKYNILIGLV